MTEHIEAKLEDIADVVIMPGDPLRAKMIAEKYLTNYKLVNKIRNNYFYTGYYNNKRVTIASSGMGMGSMGIYAYELYKVYGVKRIIRIGTCGAYTKDLKLYDTILAESIYTDSNYALVQDNYSNNTIEAWKDLNNEIIESSNKLNTHLIKGCIHSSDVFYKTNDNYKYLYDKYNCIAVEMESFALFNTARMLGKKAACLLTVSNSLVDNSQTSALERQNKFLNMVEIALNTI